MNSGRFIEAAIDRFLSSRSNVITSPKLFLVLFDRTFVVDMLSSTAFRVYEPKATAYTLSADKGALRYNEDLAILCKQPLLRSEFHRERIKLGITTELLNYDLVPASPFSKTYHSAKDATQAITASLDNDSILQEEVSCTADRKRITQYQKGLEQALQTRIHHQKMTNAVKDLQNQSLFSGCRKGTEELTEIDKRSILKFLNDPCISSWGAIHLLRCLNDKTIGQIWFDHDSNINSQSNIYPTPNKLLECLDQERLALKVQAQNWENKQHNNEQRIIV